jgi:putative MATE family efflux protein
MQQNKMAEMPIRKLLVNMSIPLMLSLLIQSLYNIVDSIFVARLSEDALAATSLVYPVQVLMIAVSVGTSVGMNALLSRLIGQQKYEKACRAATTGLLLMILSALVFSCVGIFLSPAISRMLTSDAEIQKMCLQYMQICVIFCYGIFLETCGQRMLQSVGETMLSMVSLVVGAVTNIILDPIMIFGLLGCPALGIRGAAIATVIGQCLGAAVALGLNRKYNRYVHVRFKNYKFVREDVGEIYKVGIPTIIMQAISSVMTFAVNAILLTFSSTAVAFFGVYYKLQNFLMMPINGLGQAAIPIVGFNYGAENHERIMELWKILIPTGIIFSLAATAIFMIFPRQLLGLFSASEAMLALGVPALRIISVTFVFGTITILCGYFASGLGNGFINMIGGLIRQLVLLVPCLWFFAEYMGIQYAWYAFWIAESAAFAVSLFLTKREIRNKVVSK